MQKVTICLAQLDKGMQFVQLNITSFNNKVLQWCILLSKTVHCFMLQEHKLLGSKHKYYVNKLSKYFHVYSTPARIKHSGPSGGVCILIRKDLNVLPSEYLVQPNDGDMWCCAILRIKNITLALINVYMHPE